MKKIDYFLVEKYCNLNLGIDIVSIYKDGYKLVKIYEAEELIDNVINLKTDEETLNFTAWLKEEFTFKSHTFAKDFSSESRAYELYEEIGDIDYIFKFELIGE